MDLIQLYNLTVLWNAIQAKQRIRTADINQVYKTLPDVPPMKSKEGKIKIILQAFDKICNATLERYLIEKQLDLSKRTPQEREFIEKSAKEQQQQQKNDKLINKLFNGTTSRLISKDGKLEDRYGCR
jgi:hypothetical protein